MKKSFWLGALVLVSATMYSCKSSTSSPSDVAKEFASAMLHNDFTKGKTLVTEKDQPMLDQGEEMTKANPTPDSIKAILDGAEITASNEKIENDSTASVDVKTTLKKEIMGRKESTDTYVLKKVGNAWKIDMEGTIKRVMESYGAGMPGAEQMDSLEGDSSAAEGALPTQDSLSNN